MKSQLAGPAVAAAVVGSMAVASPAGATHDQWDVGDGVCDAFEVCAFEDIVYEGRVADFHFCGDWACGYGDFSAYDYYHTSTSPNDKTSSIHNRTLKYAQFSIHSFGGGTDFCMSPGTAYPNSHPEFGDNLSSFFTTENPSWYPECANNPF